MKQEQTTMKRSGNNSKGSKKQRTGKRFRDKERRDTKVIYQDVKTHEEENRTEKHKEIRKQRKTGI